VPSKPSAFAPVVATALSGTLPLRLPERLRTAEDVGVWTATSAVAATVNATLGTDGASFEAAGAAASLNTSPAVLLNV
jgi:hypothetical protein